MKALVFGALLGLLIACPRLAEVTGEVTTFLAAHPGPSAVVFALLAGVRPSVGGWSR